MPCIISDYDYIVLTKAVIYNVEAGQTYIDNNLTLYWGKKKAKLNLMRQK